VRRNFPRAAGIRIGFELPDPGARLLDRLKVSIRQRPAEVLGQSEQIPQVPGLSTLAA
jgi:hypothetical protein